MVDLGQTAREFSFALFPPSGGRTRESFAKPSQSANDQPTSACASGSFLENCKPLPCTDRCRLLLLLRYLPDTRCLLNCNGCVLRRNLHTLVLQTKRMFRCVRDSQRSTARPSRSSWRMTCILCLHPSPPPAHCRQESCPCTREINKHIPPPISCSPRLSHPAFLLIHDWKKHQRG